MSQSLVRVVPLARTIAGSIPWRARMANTAGSPRDRSRGRASSAAAAVPNVASVAALKTKVSRNFTRIDGHMATPGPRQLRPLGLLKRRQHFPPKNGVEPALVPLPLRLEPSQHVGVHASGDLLL